MKAMLKRIFASKLCEPLVALILHFHLHKTKRRSAAPTTHTSPHIIFLSSSRWTQDLDAVFAAGPMVGYFPSDRALELLNSLYSSGNASHAANVYFNEARPEIVEARKKQAASLARIIRWLRFFGHYDGFASCSYRYVREVPLAKACTQAGVPFIGWHKEFTVLEYRFVKRRAEEAKDLGFRFFGTHLLCVNELARKFFTDAGIIDKSRIKPIGLLRADNLFAAAKACEGTPRDSVVLFSFGHLTGPFPAHPYRNYYFSDNDDFGFVELFKRSHALFARLAQDHPYIQFLIKPKNVESGWFGEIERVIRSELGAEISEIPNCRIVGDPAPALMARSLANVCLNSTTVLESRLLGCNTVVPVFAEAKDVHADMVLFRDFMDVFAAADSEDQYCRLLKRALDGEKLEQGSNERFETLLMRQLGNVDGQSGARFSETIYDIVSKGSLVSISDVEAIART